MTRAEHIQWCKDRAIQEIDYTHKPTQGIVSMMSDLRKHPDTNSEALIALCTMILIQKPQITRQEAVNFINGFH